MSCGELDSARCSWYRVKRGIGWSILLRPDLGRALDAESLENCGSRAEALAGWGFVIGDGLSAAAPARHAVPLLRELQTARGSNWTNVTTVVANHARVALGDEIGELLGAEAWWC